MPEKEGAEEKSTKSVVNKKQKQMMGEEGYDVARDEGRVKPSKDKKDATTMPPSKEMEKLRKVNKGPSALERVKADIEKRYGKDAIMKVKKESTELLEMGKKFGPGGDPIKKKGFIDKSLNKLKVNTPVKKIDTDTDVKTEEAKSLFSTPGLNKLKKFKDFKSNADRVFGRKSPDLTKVAEAFGGYIVESEIDPKTGRISATPDEIKKERKILKRFQKKEVKRITKPKPGDIEAERRILDAQSNKKAMKDAGTDQLLDKINQKSKPKRIRKRPSSAPSLADIKKRINIKNPTVVGKTGGKIPLKLGSKKAVQTVLKTGTKTAVKKAAAKGTGKLLAKRIPGIGAAISGAETFGRAASGDYVGAAISGAETIANLIPGVQQTLGTGLAGIGMARDIRRASKTAGTIRKTISTAKRARKVKSFVKTPRKIKKTLSKADTAYSPPASGKIRKAIFGKTKLGRGVRGAAVGQEFLPGGGIGRRAIKGFVGGAKKSVDGSHVGRRTAG